MESRQTSSSGAQDPRTNIQAENTVMREQQSGLDASGALPKVNKLLSRGGLEGSSGFADDDKLAPASGGKLERATARSEQGKLDKATGLADAERAPPATGLVKQVIYRLYTKPEGPTLKEFREGVAKRYSVNPTSVQLMDEQGRNLPLSTTVADLLSQKLTVSIAERSGFVKTWVFWFEVDRKLPADIDVGLATFTSLPPLRDVKEGDADSTAASKDLERASIATTFDETDLVASGSGRLTGSDANDILPAAAGSVDAPDIAGRDDEDYTLPTGNKAKKAKLD